jgi:hypothetical protein
MPRGEALVGPCSFGEWVGCGDRDFELGRLYCPPEPLELADTGDRIVADDLDVFSRPRLRLDPVRLSNPAARTGRVEATLKCVAARQRKSGIDATT